MERTVAETALLRIISNSLGERECFDRKWRKKLFRIIDLQDGLGHDAEFMPLIGEFGAGRWSLDYQVLGWHWEGWRGLVIAGGLGGLGTAGLLLLFWRPAPRASVD